MSFDMHCRTIVSATVNDDAASRPRSIRVAEVKDRDAAG
jgi:hypothetical protein